MEVLLLIVGQLVCARLLDRQVQKKLAQKNWARIGGRKKDTVHNYFCGRPVCGKKKIVGGFVPLQATCRFAVVLPRSKTISKLVVRSNTLPKCPRPRTLHYFHFHLLWRVLLLTPCILRIDSIQSSIRFSSFAAFQEFLCSFLCCFFFVVWAMEVDCKPVVADFQTSLPVVDFKTSLPNQFYAEHSNVHHPQLAIGALDGAFDDTASKRMGIGENLHRFISHTTPSLPDSVVQLSAASSFDKCFSLADLWSYYDQPVSSHLPHVYKRAPKPRNSPVQYGHEVPLVIDGRQVYAFFVPYLSAVQLFSKSPSAAPLFEYFEQLNPGQRIPLVDQVQHLALSCEFLAKGTTRDLDCARSWYSIVWYPILCDHYTNRSISGCFLTYHRFELVGDCPFVPFIHDDHESDCVAGMAHSSSCTTQDFASLETCRCEQSAMVADMDSNSVVDLDCWCALPENESFLSVAGCVAYKVRPETWFTWSENASLSAHSLYSGALKLLADARVSHPDFLHMSNKRR